MREFTLPNDPTLATYLPPYDREAEDAIEAAEDRSIQFDKMKRLLETTAEGLAEYSQDMINSPSAVKWEAMLIELMRDALSSQIVKDEFTLGRRI